MSTHCITRVYDEEGDLLLTFYRHHDGYPEGHGKELEEFLNSGVVVHGIPVGYNGKLLLFNGMDCLAAFLVSHFKGSTCGEIYIKPNSRTAQWCGAEYEYHVRFDGCGKPPKMTFNEVEWRD